MLSRMAVSPPFLFRVLFRRMFVPQLLQRVICRRTLPLLPRPGRREEQSGYIIT